MIHKLVRMNGSDVDQRAMRKGLITYKESCIKGLKRGRSDLKEERQGKRLERRRWIRDYLQSHCVPNPDPDKRDTEGPVRIRLVGNLW